MRRVALAMLATLVLVGCTRVVSTSKEKGYYASSTNEDGTIERKWHRLNPEYKLESYTSFFGGPRYNVLTRIVVVKEDRISGKTWKEYLD